MVTMVAGSEIGCATRVKAAEIEDRSAILGKRYGGVGRRRREPGEQPAWSVRSRQVKHQSSCRLGHYCAASSHERPTATIPDTPSSGPISVDLEDNYLRTMAATLDIEECAGESCQLCS